ncbi:MAG: hypothetical protein FJ128_08070 [Deltaproteobacteria bacterium]|nr:hypothetical protein [Deltaproteobacteria bacterium]
MRVALLQAPGVLEAVYDDRQDLFTVRYESVLAKQEDMLAAVFAAGRAMGQEYLPEIVEAPPSE